MSFYAVFDVKTGALVSTGTTVASADELTARGLAAVNLPGDGPPTDKVWNPNSHKFDRNPPPAPPGPDPTSEFANDPEYTALTNEEKRVVRVIGRVLLGRR